MNIKIRKFDPRSIDNNRVCVFIGKRGTGKSTLVADILYHHRNIPIGVVQSATEESNDFYKKIVPDLFIYNDYKPEVLEKLIIRQRKAIQTQHKNPSTFILLDDCMYNKALSKDKSIRAIFMNGRHWKILFMLTLQYCMDITPDLRANIDYVFVLRENIIQNREKIFKNFFGVFPNYESFSEVLNQCTENYECLVLDNTSKGNKIEDCVFWYKAKIRNNFRIGAPQLWKHHKKNYNKNHDKIVIEEDPMNKMKNKKQNNIMVHKSSKTN